MILAAAGFLFLAQKAKHFVVLLILISMHNLTENLVLQVFFPWSIGALFVHALKKFLVQMWPLS